ncbi:MAG: cobalt-zinc-cadmium efflux system protein [Variibacter sp.]|nr:cobalt-zinc-cadmium efflux system protein [Variibacter sp.]
MVRHLHDHAGAPAGHVHRPGGPGAERKIVWTMLLTGGFMVVEVVGALVSGSLALLADAGHMATDFAALVLAYAGMRFGRRPADAKRTYGYRRLEVLAAFVNGIALLALTIWIAVEAIRRLAYPVEVLSGPMMAVAVAGLLVNLAAFAILRRDASENINLSGALIHVLGDLLGSVATIAAAAVIWLTGWFAIDPILSIFVALLIVRSAWVVVHRSGHILLEGTPPELDLAVMTANLAETPGVKSASHVHVWSLTSGESVATLHLCLRDGADAATVLRAVRLRLKDEFGIGHSTIEIDFEPGAR